MFDDLPDSADAADLDDEALVAGIEHWTQAAATVAAHRFALIAELFRRRYDNNFETDDAASDAWSAVASEIATASGTSQHRGETDMEVGAHLFTRLPKVAALLKAGQLSEYVARCIVKRTELVQDRDLLAQIDTDLSAKATRWGTLSKKKLDAAIDLIVTRHDPGALKRTRQQVRDRHLWFGDTADGITEFAGRMHTTDAAALQQRATQMATAVCADDPRTLDQRRVDALGALGAGSWHLQCLCGNPTCPAAAADDGRATNLILHLYADNTTLAAEPDPLMNGEHPDPDEDEDEDEEGPAPAPAQASGGLLPGFGIIPAPVLADLIARGATVRHLQPPDVEPETGYRPRTALAESVRARDLTCRFPHCDAPAEFCDIDHTVARGDGGPTHASNLKLLCRKHHLLKTFHTGWSDVQHPDGTVVWTTPSGRTYTTKPGSSLFFPTVNTTTATVVTGTPRPNSPDKHQLMPKRRRSRAQQRASRIKAERALNDAYVAERNKPPPF